MTPKITLKYWKSNAFKRSLVSRASKPPCFNYIERVRRCGQYVGVIAHAANGAVCCSKIFFYLGFPSNPPEICSTLGGVLNIL